MSVNQCNFKGNLTRDPELRYTPNNTAIAAFGLALNHKWKDKSGEAHEDVTFIDCEAWGKTGEIIHQYVKKGDQLFVTCRAKTDEWEDKNSGQKRSKMKFVVENFDFCGGKKDGSNQESQSRPATRTTTKKASGNAPIESDENVPFAHNAFDV